MLSFFLISSMVLTVAPDRIARAFNRSRAIWAVALDTSKAFNRVWHAGLLHKLKSYGISGHVFGLISHLSNRWLWVVMGVKSLQEYPINAGVPQCSIFGSTLYCTLMTFLMMLSVILLSLLMILLSILGVILTWIWSTRHSGLGQEVACWFQC